MLGYVAKEAVYEMLENAHIITAGEYCGYCTEDIRVDALPTVSEAELLAQYYGLSPAEMDRIASARAAGFQIRFVRPAHYRKCGECQQFDSGKVKCICPLKHREVYRSTRACKEVEKGKMIVVIDTNTDKLPWSDFVDETVSKMSNDKPISIILLYRTDDDTMHCHGWQCSESDYITGSGLLTRESILANVGCHPERWNDALEPDDLDSQEGTEDEEV